MVQLSWAGSVGHWSEMMQGRWVGRHPRSPPSLLTGTDPGTQKVVASCGTIIMWNTDRSIRNPKQYPNYLLLCIYKLCLGKLACVMVVQLIVVQLQQWMLSGLPNYVVTRNHTQHHYIKDEAWFSPRRVFNPAFVTQTNSIWVWLSSEPRGHQTI